MVFEDVHRHLGLGPLPLTCSVVVIIKMMLTGKQTPEEKTRVVGPSRHKLHG